MNVPELKKSYLDNAVPALMEKLGYKNLHQVPKISKVVLNSSFGAEMDKNGVAELRKDIASIAGQLPIVVKARVSVSNFKLREGMPVGVMVTLRGNQMYEFLDRFITSTLPRVRDFQGLELKGFDGRGNFTMGIKEQIAFPEISIDKVLKVTGMDITFVTNTDSDSEALALLTEFGLPFIKSDKK